MEPLHRRFDCDLILNLTISGKSIDINLTEYAIELQENIEKDKYLQVWEEVDILGKRFARKIRRLFDVQNLPVKILVNDFIYHCKVRLEREHYHRYLVCVWSVLEEGIVSRPKKQFFSNNQEI